EVQSLMECPGGGPAVADPRHRHNLLAEIPSRHGDAGHDRDQVAQHGDRRNYVPRFQVAKMAGAVLAERWRRVTRHVLRQNIARLKASHQKRANIADHRRDPVPRTQGISRAHRDCFLAETGMESADDLVLSEQPYHLPLKLPVEPHEVVQIEVLFSRESGGHSFSKPTGGARFARDRNYKSSGLSR